VDLERFKGTCYRASNWIFLGKTTGTGQKRSYEKPNRSIKAVWGCPLCQDFRARLCEVRDEKRGLYKHGGDCRPDRASRSRSLKEGDEQIIKAVIEKTLMIEQLAKEGKITSKRKLRRLMTIHRPKKPDEEKSDE